MKRQASLRTCKCSRLNQNKLMDSYSLDKCGITNESVLELYIFQQKTLFEEEVPIEGAEEVKVEDSEYCNLIDIMNFEGSWEEKIIAVIQRTEAELLKDMPDKVRNLKTKTEQLKAMYMSEGTKILKTKFKASDQEFKLILKDIIEYLEKNKNDENNPILNSSESGVKFLSLVQ
mmetsp:Transcript_15735/g.18197  ORF Transcript_15735/g.18197 Transcript_15735/m.18197 type:complete len:174 (-) Transcript_15735:1-522(-)